LVWTLCPAPLFYHPVKAIRISQTRQSVAKPIHHWLNAVDILAFAASDLYQEPKQPEGKDRPKMARKPNYDHERRERERIKAAKKAAKANAKESKSGPTTDDAQRTEAN
jgi:hypothetical protein